MLSHNVETTPDFLNNICRLDKPSKTCLAKHRLRKGVGILESEGGEI